MQDTDSMDLASDDKVSQAMKDKRSNGSQDSHRSLHSEVQEVSLEHAIMSANSICSYLVCATRGTGDVDCAN